MGPGSSPPCWEAAQLYAFSATNLADFKPDVSFLAYLCMSGVYGGYFINDGCVVTSRAGWGAWDPIGAGEPLRSSTCIPQGRAHPR